MFEPRSLHGSLFISVSLHSWNASTPPFRIDILLIAFKTTELRSLQLLRAVHALQLTFHNKINSLKRGTPAKT